MFSSSLSQTVPLIRETPQMTPATGKSLSERHVWSMACVNQTWPHCVNQTGKTLSETAWQGNGMGAA